MQAAVPSSAAQRQGSRAVRAAALLPGPEKLFSQEHERARERQERELLWLQPATCPQAVVLLCKPSELTQPKTQSFSRHQCCGPGRADHCTVQSSTEPGQAEKIPRRGRGCCVHTWTGTCPTRRLPSCCSLAPLQEACQPPEAGEPASSSAAASRKASGSSYGSSYRVLCCLSTVLPLCGSNNKRSFLLPFHSPCVELLPSCIFNTKIIRTEQKVSFVLKLPLKENN